APSTWLHTLSLHDALPIYERRLGHVLRVCRVAEDGQRVAVDVLDVPLIHPLERAVARVVERRGCHASRRKTLPGGPWLRGAAPRSEERRVGKGGRARRAAE